MFMVSQVAIWATLHSAETSGYALTSSLIPAATVQGGGRGGGIIDLCFPVTAVDISPLLLPLRSHLCILLTLKDSIKPSWAEQCGW